jgi:acyl-coenzyme A thioesterase PaaI-like protein
VSFNVYLLRPVVESALTSRGVVTSATRNLWIADAEIKDDRGRIVGRGSGSFVRSSIALADIDAYAADH